MLVGGRLPRPATASELSQVLERCPGFTVDGVLARTGKSLLVTGTYRDAPAVAKLLIGSASLWRAKFAAELHADQVFAEHPAPVRTPRLLTGAVEAGVLVLERITGRPAATVRHPTRPLPAGDLDVILAAVDALAGWTQPTGAFDAVFDYPERFVRYGPAGHGVLTHVDIDRLTALYDAVRRQAASEVVAPAPPGWAFAHGDALLGNFLLTEPILHAPLRPPNGPDPASTTAGRDSVARNAAGCVLVDWEFAGLYLPGYDHALLWTLLHADPAARARLRSQIRADGPCAEAAWWINAAMALTREIRIHRELPVDAVTGRDRQLVSLNADLELVREELTRLAAACAG
jgi:hypothetical protein